MLYTNARISTQSNSRVDANTCSSVVEHTNTDFIRLIRTSLKCSRFSNDLNFNFTDKSMAHCIHPQHYTRSDIVEIKKGNTQRLVWLTFEMKMGSFSMKLLRNVPLIFVQFPLLFAKVVFLGKIPESRSFFSALNHALAENFFANTQTHIFHFFMKWNFQLFSLFIS